MKRLLLAAVLCLAALSGCDTFRGFLGMATHDKPTVHVVNNQITVEPDPLRFSRDQRNVTIIWRLEDGSPFTFATDGIRIDGEVKPGMPPDPRQTEIVEGRRTADGRQFVFLNRNSRPGTYKYTVRLVGPGGQTIEKDPSIVNMQ